jgi:putative protease
MHNIELLAPAGNFEKLVLAIYFGADAVYLGGKAFSLRQHAANFNLDEMQAGIDYAHRHGVKAYVTCNIFPRDDEFDTLHTYLHQINALAPDGLIVADPGILMAAHRFAPSVPVHLSTQANTTNSHSIAFWAQNGIKRVNVARETSLDEIRSMAKHSMIELEAFVHGAMCMAYSGRCLLSNYLTQRNSNQGDCSHPCRWSYSLLEETRPGKYLPIEQNIRGTAILSARDLCMIGHIPELIASGLSALKIEGRMKGINYLASTVKVYREAIDEYYLNPARYRLKQRWISELNRVNHRGYNTGFYFAKPSSNGPNDRQTPKAKKWLLVAKVEDATQSPMVKVGVRNKINTGDAIEILQPAAAIRPDKVTAIYDLDGQAIAVAQPNMTVYLKIGHPVRSNDLLRKRVDEHR